MRWKPFGRSPWLGNFYNFQWKWFKYSTFNYILYYRVHDWYILQLNKQYASNILQVFMRDYISVTGFVWREVGGSVGLKERVVIYGWSLCWCLLPSVGEQEETVLPVNCLSFKFCLNCFHLWTKWINWFLWQCLWQNVLQQRTTVLLSMSRGCIPAGMRLLMD